jgi:hypothetical protein
MPSQAATATRVDPRADAAPPPAWRTRSWREAETTAHRYHVEAAADPADDEREQARRALQTSIDIRQ